MLKPIRLGLTALLLTQVSACQRHSSDDGDDNTVSDSAGIRIVTSVRPIWSTPQWTVADTPLVTIGGGDDPTQLLHQVGGVIRFADGRIAVAHNSTEDIRVYGSDGKLLTRWGRVGDGPGEYRSLATMMRGANGNILVFEHGARLTVLDTNGQFLSRAPRLPMVEHRAVMDLVLGKDTIRRKGDIVMWTMPKLLGSTTTGDFLVVGSGGIGMVAGEVIPSGIHPIVEPIFRATPEGTLKDTVAVVTTGEFAGTPNDGPGMETQKSGVPFGRKPDVALLKDMIYYGDGGTFQITRYDTAGRVTAIFRGSLTGDSIIPADVATWKRLDRERKLTEWRAGRVGHPEGSSEKIPGEAQVVVSIDQGHSRLSFPSRRPVFDRIKADPAGYLWLHRYQDPGDQSAPQWYLLDAEGRWVGTVTTPKGLEIFDIGASTVTGVWRNQDDVEHVRVYPLSRNGA